MTSQNIALWALINTQSKGGYSNRKKGRYRKLITITFDWIGIFDGVFNKLILLKHSINTLKTRNILNFFIFAL